MTSLVPAYFMTDRDRAAVMRTYQRMLDGCELRAVVTRYVEQLPIRITIVDGEPTCEPVVIPEWMSRQIDMTAAFCLERALESHGYFSGIDHASAETEI